MLPGGGTTGLVLASRLSENPSASVLVLEAGGAHIDDDVLLVPQRRWLYLGNAEYDWGFKTETQHHAKDRIFAWSRGKGLGGSSAINHLLWNKPARQHIEAWGALGNDGWTWEKFQTYSKKSERFVKPDHDTDVLTYDTTLHGEHGAVVTSFPPVISNLEADFRKAMEAHNIPTIQDLFSGEVHSLFAHDFFNLIFTQSRGTSPSLSTLDPSTHHRAYATNMYYQPIAGRTNLKVLVNAYVTDIITTEVNGLIAATGVRFVKSDNTYTANVASEVCLTAGFEYFVLTASTWSNFLSRYSRCLASEILLFLNGRDIEVKLDLPGVGMNVQEHLYSGVTFELTDHFVGEQEVNTFDSLATNPGLQQELHASGKGSLNLNSVDIAFVALADISPELNAKVIAALQSEEKDAGLAAQYKIQAEHLREKVPSLEIILGPGPAKPPPQGWDASKKHISLCFATNCPLSRGTIHVASKDSLAIDPHVFENNFDLDIMVELVKFCRKLAQTSPLKGEGEGRLKEIHPGPDCQDDDAIAEWVRNNVTTTFHTASSCSMLPKELNGVVDPQLKVWGTHNIRVADLSVIPLHVGSHTQSVAYALAEQAADIIKTHNEK
ncbi:GMC oxidoreductase [Suillus occidentalis]|nr:GMC oxidoreductase [Suillus occidentalis]